MDDLLTGGKFILKQSRDATLGAEITHISQQVKAVCLYQGGLLGDWLLRGDNWGVNPVPI